MNVWDAKKYLNIINPMEKNFQKVLNVLYVVAKRLKENLPNVMLLYQNTCDLLIIKET
jgi:hypothetical protein